MDRAEESHVFLETERLILRRFTASDLDNLVDLDADPDVMRYINDGKPTPRDVIQNSALPRFLQYYERFDGFGSWAAIEKSSGDFLGRFVFQPAEDATPDEVELGYRLRKSAWGKGYGTEGSRALIRKGFTELGVQRVVAFTYGENLRSRRVMEKAGLALVRTFRMTPARAEKLGITDLWDGDDVEYALTKTEWEHQKAAGS
ncbi:MAG TPA: GNAT family N-acetyltransferase [Chloroflexota bacterium]|nr:GNAT family N-acetyltransferase [Chloroflexota bacterium]